MIEVLDPVLSNLLQTISKCAKKSVKRKKERKKGALLMFKDKSLVSPTNLRLCGVDKSLNSFHSLQSSRACDLMHMGLSVETIKQIGHWRSNTVYKNTRKNGYA